jgi:hypothetical protein
MEGSGSGGGMEFGRFAQPAHRVLDLAAARAALARLGEEG